MLVNVLYKMYYDIKMTILNIPYVLGFIFIEEEFQEDLIELKDK
jgi:hypothetical protein